MQSVALAVVPDLGLMGAGAKGGTWPELVLLLGGKPTGGGGATGSKAAAGAKWATQAQSTHHC